MKITPFISNRITPVGFKGSNNRKFPEFDAVKKDSLYINNNKYEAHKDTFTRQGNSANNTTPHLDNNLLYSRIFLY